MNSAERAPSERGLRFAFPDGELETWAALGDVTDRSVRVWLRVPGASEAEATLAIDGETVAATTVRLDPEHDDVGAAVLELDAPRPDAAFSVEVAGLRRTGRLAPREGAPAAFSFGFGSCHQPFEQALLGDELSAHGVAGIYPRVADRLARDDARFLLLIGDQVYADGVSAASVRDRLRDDERITDAELLDIYRHLYRGYFNHAGFRALQERWPAYLTWDDHDIFDGWGSQLDPQPFDRRLFGAARDAYREYQHLRNPGAGLGDAAPFAYGFTYADVGFFVLDLRGCRSYQEGVIVGDEQWRRLDAFLAEADARELGTVVVAASVPVVHLSPTLVAATAWIPGGTGTDIRDRWDTPRFRADREALLERLFAWRAARPRRSVVMLGGDVHVGAAFRVRARRATGWGRGTIVQWTSSAMSTPTGIEHRLANRIGTSLVNLGERSVIAHREGLEGHNNFGIVRVEPRPEGGHELTFSLHAYDARRDRLRTALRVVAPRR